MAPLSTLILLAGVILALSCGGDPAPSITSSAKQRVPAALSKQRGTRHSDKRPDSTKHVDRSEIFPLPEDSLYHVALPHRFTADRILVEKSLHRLTLMRSGKSVKFYRVALGTSPVGPKRQEGDRKTPEGVYTIDQHNPKSDWYYSLHISYPNAADRARARREGVSPGGDVMIHGLAPRIAHLGLTHARNDWTWGCIALSNPEMDELRRSVPTGIPIEIRP